MKKQSLDYQWSDASVSGHLLLRGPIQLLGKSSALSPASHVETFRGLYIVGPSFKLNKKALHSTLMFSFAGGDAFLAEDSNFGLSWSKKVQILQS